MVLEGRMREQDLLAWAAKGLEISSKTVRSWEAAAEYFSASAGVQRQVPAGQFIRWAGIGARLCADSPSLAVAYFKASPPALMRLRPRYVEDWARLGRALYRGTWKSSTLACRFYETTPSLLESLSYAEFTRFAEFLEALSLRSYDLANQCLNEGAGLFPRLGPEREAVIAVARVLADRQWREVRGFFDACSDALPNLDTTQRGRFLALARRLVHAGRVNAGEFVTLGSVALMSVAADRRGRLLGLAEGVLGVSPVAVPELMRHAPSLLQRISFTQFEEWHREGLRVLENNADAGISYYRVESARSQEVIDTLASGVELTRIRDVMRTYCRALAGQDIELSSTQLIVDKGIGWVEGDAPTTEGSTIYLPPVVDRFPSKQTNFSWYKVVATHQVGHIEFGSFEFDYDRASTMFEDLRPHLKQRGGGGAVAPAGELPPGQAESEKEGDVETRWLTDMSRFFDAFPDRDLARDVFTVVEDARMDACVMHEYRGIVSSYRMTQAHSLAERPKIEGLPMREAMLEFIIRVSLGQREGLLVPKEYKKTAGKIARIVESVSSRNVTVEDAAEASIRVYAFLYEVPNAEVSEDEFEEFDLNEEMDDAPEQDSPQFFLDALGGEGEGSGERDSREQQPEESGDDEPYSAPQEVSYRGDFKPELAQLLSQLRMSDEGLDGESMEPITEEQLAEMLEKSAEVDAEPVEGEGELREIPGDLLQNLLKEMAKRDASDPQSGQGPFVHVDEEGGPLEPTDDRSFVYDEWDFRGNQYKPRWCLVHEKDMAEGDAAFFRDTLHTHASLVRDIHRQFERMAPEMYRKIKRLEDGEDHDLDAVIEAFVDRRTGNQPSDKLFWRRNKVERDVAVAFLLDMSASTAEAIDESSRTEDDWGAPDDPVEYMVWLRSRRAEGLRRSYKRIVDIEKEGIVLLANALEMLGDTYGIYGFSGYGRENVEVYVVKDMDEQFSEAVPRRIDRIAPLHATRMGPAIRHVTEKLIHQEAKSRILFMITDGRPQDRGYSREGVEKEYAVHDTRQALVEATREGIIPFCLTVDKAGHDYMKAMMHDMNYEVLHDVRSLPQRLPHLYRLLTT